MRIPTILLAASALAACDEGEMAPPPPPPPPPAAAVVVPEAAPAVVAPIAAVSLTTATKAPFGTYVVDGAGRALYILEGTRGAPGMNPCVGPCLGVWPPVMTAGPVAPATGLNPAMVGSVPAYGGTQATYAGWQLYHYSHDAAPGDTTGQDVHDEWGVWHLLAPSGEPIRPAGGY